ncbi:MAG: hypothetical protein FWG80_03610 [Alphaproteobacteria bacterium]|nr:hypothetical protein [Alphaproteobacteria bacterium]
MNIVINNIGKAYNTEPCDIGFIIKGRHGNWLRTRHVKCYKVLGMNCDRYIVEYRGTIGPLSKDKKSAVTNARVKAKAVQKTAILDAPEIKTKITTSAGNTYPVQLQSVEKCDYDVGYLYQVVDTVTGNTEPCKFVVEIRDVAGPLCTSVEHAKKAAINVYYSRRIMPQITAINERSTR